MNFVTTAGGTEIFYKDWGKEQPIVFSHGCAREAERGLLASIESGAVLDGAFWFAFLWATWLVLQCLPM